MARFAFGAHVEIFLEVFVLDSLFHAGGDFFEEAFVDAVSGGFVEFDVVLRQGEDEVFAVGGEQG